MPHGLPLITTLASALGLALLMGLFAVKLRFPPLVGYLLAGVILGPFTPGFVADASIAAELAEIGVMLLMFGVGLHFSLDDLLETRKIALPGALLQILVATLLGGGLALYWGWDMGNALIFGLALSVASTVVLIRALEDQGLSDSINGQIAVGWLVVEDLAMIVVLVLLPLLAGWFGDSVPGHDNHLWSLLGTTFVKICAFIAVMLLLGRWILPALLWHISRTGSRELFTLCVMVAAVSIAFGASQLFGVSLALGAFFAGMIIRESKFSRRAAEESLPFRDAFAVLFFVSVGMLFNPYIFVEQPMRVLAVIGIIIVGKSLAAAALVLAFRYPLNTALTVSASLAQIGEFSFVLAAQGVHYKLLTVEGQELVIAGALISMALNPLLFQIIKPIQALLRSHSAWASHFERSDDPLVELPQSTHQKFLSRQVVLVGYGRVGRRIATNLLEHDIPFVVIEQNRELVEQLREEGLAAVYGDASDAFVLIQAHIARAGLLVLATSDAFDVRAMVSMARQLNPDIDVAMRVEDEDEAQRLQDDVGGAFFLSDKELAHGMTQHILQHLGKAAAP